MPVTEINQNVLQALTTEINTSFSTRLDAEPESSLFSRLVLTTQSTRGYENYAWMLGFAAMREWIGERQVMNQYILDQYLIRNKSFEHTMSVKIEDIMDGVYAVKAKYDAAEEADAYIRRKNDMIFDLLISSFGEQADFSDETTWFTPGSTVLGPDGVALFSDAHPRGQMIRQRSNGQETYRFKPEGTFSNITDLSFSKENLKTVRKLMRKQQDHYGRSARLNGNLLVVGPELEDAAKQAVAPNVAIVTTTDGTVVTEERVSNSLASAYEVLVVNELGDSPAWFVFDTTRSAKPFIFQNRLSPVRQRTAALNQAAAFGLVTPDVFNSNEIKYGTWARMGCGIGHPLTAYGSTGIN